MDTIAASFANLVKTNNGLFKSPMQAGFLLSKCTVDNNTYVTSGSVHGSSFSMFYVCDDKGVVRVEKQTRAKGLTTEWERRVEGKVSLQDEKEIKRIKRLIKQTEKSIADRTACFAAGQYSAPEHVYRDSHAHDQRALDNLNQMLANLTK